MEHEKLILITNDDGIEARGLKSLIEVVREFGKVVVVAPEESQSGMSHAITMKFPLRIIQERKSTKIISQRSSTQPSHIPSMMGRLIMG